MTVLDIRLWVLDCTLYGQVCGQDERLREKGTLIKGRNFTILSVSSPEFYGNELFIRGCKTTHDNHVFSCDYGTSGTASMYKTLWEEAVAQLNAEWEAKLNDAPSETNPHWFEDTRVFPAPSEKYLKVTAKNQCHWIWADGKESRLALLTHADVLRYSDMFKRIEAPVFWPKWGHYIGNDDPNKGLRRFDSPTARAVSFDNDGNEREYRYFPINDSSYTNPKLFQFITAAEAEAILESARAKPKTEVTAEVKELREAIKTRNAKIEKLGATIREKDSALSKRNATIKELETRVESLMAENARLNKVIAAPVWTERPGLRLMVADLLRASGFRDTTDSVACNCCLPGAMYILANKVIAEGSK